MEYNKLTNAEAGKLKEKRMELKGGGLRWRKLLSELTPMNGISTTFVSQHELRLAQFCLYRAAKRMKLSIITFKHLEDGVLTLTIWLAS